MEGVQLLSAQRTRAREGGGAHAHTHCTAHTPTHTPTHLHLAQCQVEAYDKPLCFRQHVGALATNTCTASPQTSVCEPAHVRTTLFSLTLAPHTASASSPLVRCYTQQALACAHAQAYHCLRSPSTSSSLHPSSLSLSPLAHISHSLCQSASAVAPEPTLGRVSLPSPSPSSHTHPSQSCSPQQHERKTLASRMLGTARLAISAASISESSSSSPPPPPPHASHKPPHNRSTEHIKELRSRPTISSTQEDLEYERIERRDPHSFHPPPQPPPPPAGAGAAAVLSERNESRALRFLIDGVQLLYRTPREIPIVREPPHLSPEEEIREKDRIKQLFNRIDSDADGVLSPLNLQKELERLRLPFTQTQITDILQEADKEKDGKVTFEDFYYYVVRKERALFEVFQAMDHNHDGHLHVDEVKTSFEMLGYDVSDEDVKKLMARFDMKREGYITWENWRELLIFLPMTHVIDVLDYWCDATIMAEDDIILHPTEETTGVHGRLWKHFVAGGIAGVVSRTCTAPLDRLKVVLQVQAPERKLGVVSGFRAMVQEGGIRSLWRGNGVNVLKIGPESAIKFYAWEQAKRLLYPNDDKHEIRPHQRLLAGALAGLISQSAIFPMEVLKTRLATSRTGQFRGMLACAMSIWRTEGGWAFYRGMLPAMLGVIPYAGIDLAVYETLRASFVHTHPDQEPGAVTLLGYGAVSSTAGQLASYPLALVRTRLQACPHIKHGMIEEFKHVVRQGGFMALYRGMAANVLKVVPAVSISYVIFEKTKAYLK